MAFTAYEIVGEAPSGDYDTLKLLAGYTIVWRLYSDDRDDGPQQAIKYVQEHVTAGQILDGYTWQNDSRLSAVLTNIGAKFVGGSGNPWCWIATLSYADQEPDDDEEQDEQGNPTTNPLDFRPVVDVRTVQYLRPVAKATFKGGFSGIAAQKVPKDLQDQVIVNSALVPFDPPVEVDSHRWTIRIKRNFLEVNADILLGNQVNSQGFTLKYRGLTKIVGERRAKSRDVSVAMARFGGDDDAGIAPFDYLQVELHLEVLRHPDDWRLHLLDRGYHARAMIGDPTGKGGGGSDAYVKENPPAGQPALRRLNDTDGLPSNEPVLLNGDGQPLDMTETPIPSPVYGEWRHYPEVDMTAWPMLLGLIE